MRITGTAALHDHTTDVSLSNLEPGSTTSLNVFYVDEDGDRSFAVSGYDSDPDGDGNVAFVVPIGKVEVQAATGKDIDHVEVEVVARILLRSRSD